MHKTLKFLKHSATFLFLFLGFLSILPAYFDGLGLLEFLLIVDIASSLPQVSCTPKFKILLVHILLLDKSCLLRQFVESFYNIDRGFGRGFKKYHVTVFLAELLCFDGWNTSFILLSQINFITQD